MKPLRPRKPLHRYWIPDEHKQRHIWRQKVTLCIAAICEDQDRKQNCIVVSSDWKAEVGDIAGAEIQNKLYWIFDKSWPTLIAGTASEAHDLVACYRSNLNPKEITKRNLGYRIRDAALKRKAELADEYVRARLGVDFQYFKDNKDKIDPTVWSGIWNDIKKMTLDCQLIICTFIDGEPYIYQVEEDGKAWRDDNFVSIGTGSTIANSLLCFRQQDEENSLIHTLYNVFEATRFAYKAQSPGVGKQHAFSILYAGEAGKVNSFYITNKGQDTLKAWYSEYGPKETSKSLKLSDKFFRRY
jgi:20S proteasome alpha/beta subunit